MDFMPSDTLNAIIEDAIIDLSISRTESLGLTQPTKEVVSKIVEDVVSDNLEITTALIATGIRQRVVFSTWMYFAGESITMDRLNEKFAELHRADRRRSEKLLIVTAVNGVREATVRVPSYRPNEGYDDNLGSILVFLSEMLSIPKERIRLVRTYEVGSEVSLPAPLAIVMSKMTAAIRHPEGDYPEQPYKTKGSFIGNPVELLAALRLLKIYAGKLRAPLKKRNREGKLVSPNTCNQEYLKTCFTTSSGLAQVKSSFWSKNIFYQILAELVKATNPHFPGVWLHAARARNSVTTNDGILMRLGWMPIAADPHKTMEVFTTYCREGQKGKKELFRPDFQKGESIEPSFGEFRAAVLLTLPYLKDSSEPIRSQLVDPLRLNNKTALTFFEQERELVEAANMAYSIESAILKRKSKDALPVHFELAKQTVVARSANIQFQDALGQKYSKFHEIPENLRNFLAKFFHKSESISKAHEEYLERLKRDDEEISSMRLKSTPNIVVDLEPMVSPSGDPFIDEKEDYPSLPVLSALSLEREKLP